MSKRRREPEWGALMILLLLALGAVFLWAYFLLATMVGRALQVAGVVLLWGWRTLFNRSHHGQH